MCIKLKGVWRTVKTQKSFYLQLESESQTLSCATLPAFNQLFSSVCLSGSVLHLCSQSESKCAENIISCLLPSLKNQSSRMKNRISVCLYHFIFHLVSTFYFQRTLTLSKNVLLLPSSPISFLTFLQRTI